ncbi:MAG: copper amine oxidase N-terminal domain-containing protein [Peptococcaceae bacterium]|nr:copper amine oxidase N-terminal domain-containing protein [Peptococcaceae bacterium]
MTKKLTKMVLLTFALSATMTLPCVAGAEDNTFASAEENGKYLSENKIDQSYDLPTAEDIAKNEAHDKALAKIDAAYDDYYADRITIDELADISDDYYAIMYPEDRDNPHFSLKTNLEQRAAVIAYKAKLKGEAVSEQVTPVDLWVNNVAVDADASLGQAYINADSRTMVPLRVVGDALDYETTWLGEGKISVTDDDLDVALEVGSTTYTVNGEAQSLRTAPAIRDGRVYLPVRDLGEIYGTVVWESGKVMIFEDRGNVPWYYMSASGNLVRVQNHTVLSVTTPDVGWTGSKGYAVDNASLWDEQAYVRVQDFASQGEAGRSTLFRDDGDHMTQVMTLNWSTSYAIKDGKIYHTDGTEAGSWTANIKPNRLMVTTVGDRREDTLYYDLDFAVNACTLGFDNDSLVATDKDGTRHVIDLSKLTPTQQSSRISCGPAPE